FLLACSSNIKTIEVQNDAGVIIERYEQNVKTEQKEGKSEFFTDEGELLETAFYENGELNGKRILYHENGEIQAIEQYVNGEFSDIYQAFYENKQLELEGKYINGQMEGEWKRYYDSGELMEVVTFAANEENGPFVEYYKNGKMKAAGAYLDGDNEHGELKLFDENGELTKKMNCEKGICRTIWTKEEGEKKI
ncbi:MAG: hypothetical protein AAGJ18_18195, partial [Bacteroidota bacterium]